jgi:hypothetical protein
MTSLLICLCLALIPRPSQDEEGGFFLASTEMIGPAHVLDLTRPYIGVHITGMPASYHGSSPVLQVKLVGLDWVTVEDSLGAGIHFPRHDRYSWLWMLRGQRVENPVGRMLPIQVRAVVAGQILPEEPWVVVRW